MEGKSFGGVASEFGFRIARIVFPDVGKKKAPRQTTKLETARQCQITAGLKFTKQEPTADESDDDIMFDGKRVKRSFPAQVADALQSKKQKAYHDKANGESK